MIKATWEELGDVVRTLLAVLIHAGETYKYPTEIMLRLYCAGLVRVEWDEERESVNVQMIPEGRDEWLREHGESGRTL